MSTMRGCLETRASDLATDVHAGVLRCGVLAPPSSVKIHEYQAKSVLARFGVPVPRGEVAFSAAEAGHIARRLGGAIVVVKAQIHAGGRGKGGGVKLARSADEAEQLAKQIIGMTLVTHQTGPEGRKVARVLIEEGLPIENELYLSIVLDRALGGTGRHRQRGGRHGHRGGRRHATRRRSCASRSTPAPASSRSRRASWRSAWACRPRPRASSSSCSTAVYKAFIETDASMIEINPLILTKDGDLLALDAKITFDDNAMYRHRTCATSATSAKKIRSKWKPRSSR